jgi:histidine phosphotransferase ChpT
MTKIIELSQALNAKLCHDLAGAIGTVDNCLSLIDNKNQDIGKQAKDLAIEESANLVNRIKFFRTAYGISEGETKMSLVNLSKLLQDFFLDTKIEFSLDYDPGVLYIDSIVAKTTICLAVIAGDSAIFGGKLVVTVPIKDEDPILIKCSGKNIIVKDDNLNVLNGVKDVSVTVQNCREHYINTLCVHANYELEIDKSDATLEFKLNKK